MDVTGKVTVVTGGASGIGAATCAALASRGAGAVVVSDIDADGAATVAAQLLAGGARALAVPTDVSKEADVQALVAQTEDAFGPVDLFFSNAGIIVPGGVEASDTAWTRSWAINVQSHVYAARALLPGMLARKSGYLVFTASAAGLLTQLGSAPYAVTKHAVVALAEWLSITHGDQGIGVSCLCPQAVSTNLLSTSRRQVPDGPDLGNTGPDDTGPDDTGPDDTGPHDTGPAGNGEPARAGGSAQAAVDGVLSPAQVADSVLAAIAAETFLILPHPDVATYERRRAEDRDRWLRGMRRMQARLFGGQAQA